MRRDDGVVLHRLVPVEVGDIVRNYGHAVSSWDTDFFLASLGYAVMTGRGYPVEVEELPGQRPLSAPQVMRLMSFLRGVLPEGCVVRFVNADNSRSGSTQLRWHGRRFMRW